LTAKEMAVATEPPVDVYIWNLIWPSFVMWQ